MTDKTNRQIDIMLLGEEAPKRITVDKLDEIIMDERDKVLAEQAMSTPATMAAQPTGELPMSEQDDAAAVDVESFGGDVRFFLNPYAGSQHGKYFSTLEEYEALAERYMDMMPPIEEWEIDWIDGDEKLRLVWEAAGGSSSGQMILEQFMDEVVDAYLEDYEFAALGFLMGDLGYDLGDALMKYNDVSLYPGTPEDYAEEYMDDVGGIPDNLRMYIDFAAMARDMGANGAITEFSFDGEDYVATNADAF